MTGDYGPVTQRQTYYQKRRALNVVQMQILEAAWLFREAQRKWSEAEDVYVEGVEAGLAGGSLEIRRQVAKSEFDRAQRTLWHAIRDNHDVLEGRSAVKFNGVTYIAMPNFKGGPEDRILSFEDDDIHVIGMDVHDPDRIGAPA